jgi:hypothetical protein
LALAQVTVHSVERNGDRTVVSSSEGVFVVENLEPGRYQLTAKKDGFTSSPAITVELAAQQSLRVDITLASPNGSGGSVLPTGPASPSVNTADNGAPNVSTLPAALSAGSRGQLVAENSGYAPPTEREKQLLDRIGRLEQRLAAMEARETKGAAPTASPTQPQPLLASLQPAAGLPPAEKPKELAIVLTSGTPAVAKPAGASVGGSASQSASSLVESKPVKAEKPAPAEPFAYADWTWLNGTPRTKDSPLEFGKYFTGEFRADTHYMLDFNHPRDDTLGGSTESFRSNEVQVEQLSFGGDLHVGNVRGSFFDHVWTVCHDYAPQ